MEIDSSEQNLAQSKPAPYSPVFISLVALIFSIIPAAIIYILNFDRLDCPNRKRLEVFRVSVVIILTFLISPRNPAAFYIVLVIELSLIFYLYRSQIGLYRVYLAKGGKPASIWKPIIILIGLSLLINIPSIVTSYRERARNAELSELIERKDYLQAEKKLIDRVNGIEPSTFEDHYLLALVYFHQNKLELSKNKLDYYLSIFSSDKKAQKLRSDIQGRIGKDTAPPL